MDEKLLVNVAKIVCILAEARADEMYHDYVSDRAQGRQFIEASKVTKNDFNILRNLIDETRAMVAEKEEEPSE